MTLEKKSYDDTRLFSIYDEKKDEFVYNGGIIEYVQMLNKTKKAIHEDIIYVEGRENDILVEVAMQYNESYNSSVYSFTNNIHNIEGGTHEDGVKNALTRTINNYARNAKLLKELKPLKNESPEDYFKRNYTADTVVVNNKNLLSESYFQY